ncbi:MAG: 4Fe-4S binding protein [Candidatus Omnitrophica bacterium]|nr:4Fe-4S binding protein [Candidatus Omnitrophota bacterium]
MLRKIIKIDENKCNGCGACVPDCPEGALQIIDGKARLVGELLCDGLGACIGNCPEGAIAIEEREAEEYDEKKVMENVVKAGENVITAHIKHLKDHGQREYLEQAVNYLKEHNISIPASEEKTEEPLPCGCPGTMMKDFRSDKTEEIQEQPSGTIKSELRQWPTQLHLVSPGAPYFQDCELLVAGDCVPFTYADFHRRFLKGKILIMFCPKLDAAMDMYLEKLTAIIQDNNIKSITVVKMEVPCCGGALKLTEEALKKSGKNIVVKEYTISIKGEIK